MWLPWFTHDMTWDSIYFKHTNSVKQSHIYIQSHCLPKVPGSSPATVVMVKLFISFKPETDVNKVCVVAELPQLQ